MIFAIGFVCVLPWAFLLWDIQFGRFESPQIVDDILQDPREAFFDSRLYESIDGIDSLQNFKNFAVDRLPGDDARDKTDIISKSVRELTGNIFEFYSEREVHVLSGAHVWIQVAAEKICVKENVIAQGLLKAKQEILFEKPEASFQQLRAPLILFSEAARNWRGDDFKLVLREEAPEILDGELYLSPESCISLEKNYVVYGDIIVSSGVHLHGSLRAYGKIKIETGAMVHGHVIASEDLSLEEGSIVVGALISEKKLRITNASSLAGFVVADEIEIQGGAYIENSVQVIHRGGWIS